MFRSAIAAMKPLRDEKVLGLAPSVIRSISHAISFRVCSSLVMARDKGVGGGCLGYCSKIRVDLDLCKSQGCKENVDLVFWRRFSI